jgi:hypothetical protein
MSFDLAAHPIGIKFWTNLWKTNKDLNFTQFQAKISEWTHLTVHRKFGRYFYAHRAGFLGVHAPFVAAFLMIKVGAMAYGSGRDRAAAVDCAAAYGMGGHMLDATPK